MALLAHGKASDKNPLREETQTLVVNAHGALITLAAKVTPGQTLILRNPVTGEEQECRVVHIGNRLAEKTEVGIEFMQPAPKFWRIAFPPEDWTPRHPDARRRTSS